MGKESGGIGDGRWILLFLSSPLAVSGGGEEGCALEDKARRILCLGVKGGTSRGVVIGGETAKDWTVLPLCQQRMGSGSSGFQGMLIQSEDDD